jgi:hypothetical protein
MGCRIRIVAKRFYHFVELLPKKRSGFATAEFSIEVAAMARPSDFMAICTKTKEWNRLASFTLLSTETELENISHFVSEPAAKSLAKPHPAAAAALFRALGMRILKAGKSKYYTEAIENLKNAKACYQKAGLSAQWDTLVAEILRDHRRKHGFLSAFNHLSSRGTQLPEPSFRQKSGLRLRGRRIY